MKDLKPLHSEKDYERALVEVERLWGAKSGTSNGDRLDNLAQRYIGDPEQFWRLCDANGAMRPDELTEVIGRRLRITLPAGLAGAASA